ncbi:hypothetical protein D3C77_409440 [compost metagenome]
MVGPGPAADGNDQLQVRVLISNLRKGFEIHEIEFWIPYDHFAIIDVTILSRNSRVFAGPYSASKLLPAKIGEGVIDMRDLRYINILRVEITLSWTSRPRGVISNIIIIAAWHYCGFLACGRRP